VTLRVAGRVGATLLLVLAGCGETTAPDSLISVSRWANTDQLSGEDCPDCHDPTPQERTLIQRAINYMPGGMGQPCEMVKGFIVETFGQKLGITINDKWGQPARGAATSKATRGSTIFS
jgi:hypothetical protein